MSGCPRISPLRLRLKRTVSFGGILIGGETQHLRRPARISLTELKGCSRGVLCANAAIDAMLLTTAAITTAGIFRDQRWHWAAKRRFPHSRRGLGDKPTIPRH